MTSESDIQWCQQTFRLLALGGVWGVPRSGLLFEKTSELPPVMALKETMPHDPAMPLSVEDLSAYQRDDFLTIKEKFATAGIEIRGDACRWFALCTNITTKVADHPVLGPTPCCDRCAERVGGTNYVPA